MDIHFVGVGQIDSAILISCGTQGTWINRRFIARKIPPLCFKLIFRVRYLSFKISKESGSTRQRPVYLIRIVRQH